MAFELRARESLQKGVRRIARKQLKSALAHRSAAQGEADDAVHEIRKSLKRVRALLRLVRCAVGESAYKFENESLRNAARPLSEIRDAKVLVEALDHLQETREDAAPPDVFEELREALTERRQRLHENLLVERQSLDATETALRSAVKRVDAWSDVSNRWRDLGRGIRQVYHQGRDAYDDATADPSVENLHELRKQVKYLRHQLEILTPLWPKVLKELTAQAEHLGEVLGADHDLAVLQQVANDHLATDSESSQQLDARIAERRKELQADAIAKGELLYRDSPRKFSARLKGCWRQWRKKEATRRKVRADDR